AKVRFVCGKPVKERAAHFAPARLFGRPAEPVKPGNHPAGRRLRQPHRGLRRGLRRMTPRNAAVAVSACHVRDRSPFHYRLSDAALLSAIPNDRIARTTLMIRVEPSGHLAKFLDVLYRANPAAEVSHVY